MRTHPSKRTLAFIVLGLLAIAGCSQLPTKPQFDIPGHAQATAASQMGLTDPESSDPGPAPAPGPGIGPVPTPASVESASSSVRISGLLGGTVSAGAFKVVIPPLAIQGTATVTVSQSDLSKLQCDLSISPASANHFFLPVTLVADASSLPQNKLSVSTIQWYDPSTAKWEDVSGASVNLLVLSVQAPLWHFSQYRVDGRAGW